jgi:transposase
MMADQTRPVTGGVDTHKDFHVAAVIDPLGAVIATEVFENRTAGHRRLAGWLGGHGPIERVGVEGTSSYGAGLSRHLRSLEIEVVEVNRPDRSQRRRVGKTDPLDAIAAARAALSGRHAGIPKAGDGIVEAIRMLRLCRRSAMQARTQTANQLHALVDTAPEPFHDRWAPLALPQLLQAATQTTVRSAPDTPGPAAVYALGTLTQRWVALTGELDDLDRHLDELVATAAPTLVTRYGFGTNTTGALLVAAGDNPDRLHSEASFAALCGVSPIPASSGRTTRHRLNRGGNRDANYALWVIAMVRMSHHPETRRYVDRRTTEGLSKREILRCLKRYIAREAYPYLRDLNR